MESKNCRYLNVADDVRAKYSTADQLPETSDEWLDNNTVTGARYFRDVYELDVYETIAGYSGNVLILQGVADTTVPYAVAVRAVTESYANQNADLVLIAGEKSGHAFDMFFQPGRDTAASAMIESLSNWQEWNVPVE